MKMTKKNSILLVVSMIFIAAFTRLIPHQPNFTAVGAIALFGAAFLKSRHMAIIVTFAAIFISDLFLNNLIYHSFNEGFTFMMQGSIWVYLAIGLVVLAGRIILKKSTPVRFLGGAVGATLIFFLVTNIGHWAGPFGLHPRNFAGLLATFVDALPFVLNTLAGNLFFGAVLFGIHEWVTHNQVTLDTQFEVDKY